MAVYPHFDPSAPHPTPAALVGPVGLALCRCPAFIALQLPPSEFPMVLAGLARLLLEEDRAIYCADGCNRFDPYRFSGWARAAGLDPAEVLRRVYLSRAFTIHQLAALACQEFPRLPVEPRPPLLVVLGIEELFLDEQLPRFEREHLFRKIVASMVALRSRGFSLLVTLGDGSGQEVGTPSSKVWLRLVEQAADALARVRLLAGGAFALECPNPGPRLRELLLEAA